MGANSFLHENTQINMGAENENGRAAFTLKGLSKVGAVLYR